MIPRDETASGRRLTDVEMAIAPYRDLRLALQPFAMLFDAIDDAIRDVGVNPARFAADLATALHRFDIGRPDKLAELERALVEVRRLVEAYQQP